jgi:KaiC/GvpD/RAD55 family RecA-like ATPase
MVASNSASIGVDGAVQLLRANDIRRRAMRWLWPGRIPMRAVTILDGDPGAGKTLIAADLAVRVAGGYGMPDGAAWDGMGNGAPVVYIGLDESLDVFLHRLDAAGGDRHGQVYVWPEGAGVSMPLDVARVTALIVAVKASLVIVDTLVRTADETLKLEVYQDATKVVGAWDAIARATGAAVVVVNHRTKVAGADAMSRGYGSKGGVAGVARSMLGASRDHGAPEGQHRFYLEAVKASYSALGSRLAYRIVSALVEATDDDGAACDVVTARIDWLLGQVAYSAGEVRARNRAASVAREDEVARKALADGPLARDVLDARLHELGVAADRVNAVRERCARGRRKSGTANVWEYVLREGIGTDVQSHGDDVDAFELGPMP